LLITIAIATRASTRNTRNTGWPPANTNAVHVQPAGAREEDQSLQDDALKRGSDEGSTPSSDSAKQNLGFHPKT
jgi:hypothetical protein